jgi:membrane dipeptidase
MIFDAHGDILTDLYEKNIKGEKDTFRNKHYPNYKAAGISHSIFVNWTDPYQGNQEGFNQTFELAIEELKTCSDIVKICHTYKDIELAKQENKLGVILGIESIKFLAKPEDIIALYQKGVRHVGLTWNEENEYATGLDKNTSGLKEQGEKLLKIMQELGMIIDLAHANPQTFNDVMAITKGPIIVSHGNAKALCDHRRNYTDEQLLMLKKRNGVIGVCAVPYFISSEIENQTVDFLAKHIDYIVKLIGIDHVGIGLDVFYYLTEGKSSTGVKGLETIAQAKQLLDRLEQMGYSEQDIKKIAHLNFDRVLKEVLL